MGAPVRAGGIKHHLDFGWRKKVVAGIIDPVAVSFATAGATQTDIIPLDSYPCDPDKAIFSSEEIRSELAWRCLHDLHGKVALVGVGVDDLHLKDLATRSKALIKRATGGIFDPDIVALQAPAEVNVEARSLPEQCADPGDSGPTSPMAIDRLMHLGNFDHVVTVSNLPVCKKPGDDPLKETAGLAYPQDNGRYAEEFELALLREETTLNKDAFVLDHELLHGENLGNVGSFDSFRLLDGDKLSYFPHVMSKYRQFTVAKNIDLDYLFGDGSFVDNGAPYNVMGVIWNDQNDGVILNSLQRWRLEWPQRVEGTETDWLKKLDNNAMLLENPTDINHYFGVIDLPRNVEFTDDESKKHGEAPLSCNQLVIDPIYDPRSHAKDIVEVSFAKNLPGHSLEMVSMGYLDFSSPDLTRRILRVSGQKITIDKKSDGYSVSSISDGKS